MAQHKMLKIEQTNNRLSHSACHLPNKPSSKKKKMMQNTVQTVVHRVQQCPPTRPKRRSIQPPRPGGHWNPVCWCTSIEAIACDRGWAYARTSRRFVTSWWAAGTSRLWPIVSSSRQRSRRSAAGAGKCFAGGRRHRRGGWPCPVCMTRVCLPGLIKLRRCLECSLKSRPLCREFRGRRQVSCVRERRPAHAVSLSFIEGRDDRFNVGRHAWDDFSTRLFSRVFLRGNQLDENSPGIFIRPLCSAGARG